MVPDTVIQAVATLNQALVDGAPRQRAKTC